MSGFLLWYLQGDLPHLSPKVHHVLKVLRFTAVVFLSRNPVRYFEEVTEPSGWNFTALFWEH